MVVQPETFLFVGSGVLVGGRGELTKTFKKTVICNNDNNNNERVSRAPFHVKHA